MKTVFTHLRDRLHAKAGIADKAALSPMVLFKSEWSSQFETYQRNRLVMGALRYGPIGNGQKSGYNRLAGIRKRLAQYEADGNTERLVDVANLALLEFIEGTHPLKHFSAIDGDHSCV
jgi:hypothetical protein